MEQPGRVTRLALIQSYDPTSGVISERTPVAPQDIPAILAGGYDIVSRITDHDPYTHVITTGTHDYLATIEEYGKYGE